MARKKRKYSYWEQRRAREMFDLMETAEETASELKGLYYKASAETESEAIRVIKRFQLKNHLTEKEAYALLEKTRTPEDIRSAVAQLKKNPKNAELAAEVESPAYAARVRELQGVQARVDQTVKDLYRVTKTKTDDTLDYIAKESYYREMFSLQQQVGEAFPIEDMTAEDLERIVRTRWSGASYSERIWENTQELADAVKEEMLLSVLTGKSLNRIARDIQKKFGGTFNSARRLVRTEACYVTNQIQLEAFRRAGVKEYIYSAILDERTSEICRDLDGQRFKVKNAKVGVNYPPMHPWCRSSVVAAMPESLIDRLKRKARNFWGRIRSIPKSLSFNDWARSLQSSSAEMVFSDPLRNYDDDVRGLSYEKAKVYNENGELLIEADGSKKEVFIEVEDAELLRGAYLTHNHPSGASLSADDLWSMHESELKQVRAVVEEGAFYANNPSVWPDELSSREAMQSAWDEEFINAEELSNRLAYKGVFGTSRRKYLAYRADIATRNLCRKYGIPYGFEKR